MNQKEKSRRSRARVLEAAFAEFAAQGYQGASVNAICAAGGLSKGLLYHYYADKDALYLACAEQCFGDLTDWLGGQLTAETVTADGYFDARLAFFRDHPLHQRLFQNLAADPPPHLKEEIAACRAAFDALNGRMLAAILDKEHLRPGLAAGEALRLLRLLADFVSTGLKDETPAARETLCRQLVHTMLYGLVTRP